MSEGRVVGGGGTCCHAGTRICGVLLDHGCYKTNEEKPNKKSKSVIEMIQNDKTFLNYAEERAQVHLS